MKLTNTFCASSPQIGRIERVLDLPSCTRYNLFRHTRSTQGSKKGAINSTLEMRELDATTYVAASQARGGDLC